MNTLFNGLANQPDFAKLDFSGLAITNGGGMAVQEAVAKKWLAITGCPIVEGYGLSETSAGVTCNPTDSEAYTGTIGLPLPNVEIKLLDDHGKEVPLGEAGEIAIRGPQVMQGYWQRPDETALVMTPDGFFKSGDIGEMDARGYIKIVDRKKDMIIVSGFKVFPNEIEAVVASHPGVLECAVVGVPDTGSGEAVMLFVVRKDPSLTKEALADVLQAAAHRLQAAEIHRVPRRAAQDQCRQDPAARTARRHVEKGGLNGAPDLARRLQPHRTRPRSPGEIYPEEGAMTPAKLFAVAAVGLSAAACSYSNTTTAAAPAPVAYRSGAEQACVDYGFNPGTDSYNRCVVREAQSRAAAACRLTTPWPASTPTRGTPAIPTA